MSFATFLLLVQILNGLGGAGIAFIKIQKDLESKGIKPFEPIPDEHLTTVKALLAPAQANDSTAESFIENTLAK
jgi:hypothetical protein